MEKEATTQEDAAHAREGVGALKWLASAVDASVCGVGGNHLGRLLGWLDAKKLVNGGLLRSELSSSGNLYLKLAIRWRVLAPIRNGWLTDAKGIGCRRLRAVVL